MGQIRDGAAYPINMRGNRIRVPVTVEETEALLLLDTGYTRSLLTPELAEKLKLRQGKSGFVVTPVGVNRTRYCEIPIMTVAGLRFANIPGLLGPREDPDEHGILGWDVLSQHSWILDIKRQTFRWVKSLEPDRNDWVIPIRSDGCAPTLSVTASGKHYDCTIDTGYAGILSVGQRAKLPMERLDEPALWRDSFGNKKVEYYYKLKAPITIGGRTVPPGATVMESSDFRLGAGFFQAATRFGIDIASGYMVVFDDHPVLESRLQPPANKMLR